MRADGRRIAYVYDAAGRRVARKVDGQTTHRWVWQDSLRIAAEVDAAGNTVARYIHGDRPNVPEAMLKDGKTWRLVSDHLGSVRLVIDATTGQVAQRIDYDEWGQVLSDSNPGFQPFGYAGGLYDPDTGLVRFGARDYDAATGRWTTKDPIGFGGGDSNLYGYVGGSPIGRTDPLGLWSVEVGGYLGGGGSLTFGRDPASGSGFMALKLGKGLGFGVAFDPLGGRAGGKASQCKGGGVGLGFFAEAGGNWGPASGKFEANWGRNFLNWFLSSEGYGGIQPKASLDSKWGVGVGAAAGVELSVFGSGDDCICPQQR